MTDENRYVLGIDGGGSKTSCEIRYFNRLSAAGDILRSEPVRFCTGAMNTGTKDEMRAAISEILNFMREAKGGMPACKFVCIGTAGAGKEYIIRDIELLVRENGYTGGLLIAGDDVIALKAGLGGKSGAIIISGTGSICTGINKKGERFRAGGFGHIIDDEGSGYSIGRDILSAIVRGADGRGENTVLKDLVFDQLKIRNLPELISIIYSPRSTKKEIAALSPLLMKALEKNDAAAYGICKKAACELALLAGTVLKKLDEDSRRIVMYGSIFMHYGLIRNLFIEELKQSCPDVFIGEMENYPETGAVLMAAENVAKSNP